MGIKVDKILGVVRESDTTTSLPASSVVFTPNGDISAVTVQAAIQEVRDDAVTKINAAVVGLLDDRGGFTPTTSYPTTGGSGTAGAILKGDIWQVTGLGIGVTALMGGVTVSDGQWFRALIDTPGQTDANWTETSSGGASIYTADGTSTSAARIIKTYGNTASDYYSFQTLVGGNLLKLKGDSSIDFGSTTNPSQVNFYTSSGAPDNVKIYSGATAWTIFDSQSRQVIFRAATGYDTTFYEGKMTTKGADAGMRIVSETGVNIATLENEAGAAWLYLRNAVGTNKVYMYVDGGQYYMADGCSFGYAPTGAPVAIIDVRGNSIFQGGGSTSVTYNSIWKNSSSVQAMAIRDDGKFAFGTATDPTGTFAATFGDSLRNFGAKWYLDNADNAGGRVQYIANGYAFMEVDGYSQALQLNTSGSSNAISLNPNNVRITTTHADESYTAFRAIYEGIEKITLSSYGHGGRLALADNVGNTDVWLGRSGYYNYVYGNFAIGARVQATYKLEVHGSSYFNGIVHNVKGANIASAADLTLTTNSHTITGTTTINAMTILPFIAGDHITLVFSGATTVKHNTAGGAGTAVFKLAGSVDFVTAADTVLGLYYDGTVFQQTFEKHS